MDILVQQIINALAVGGTYALVALGLALVFSVLGLINFAHGELLTLTGYGIVAAITFGAPFALAIPAGIVVAAVSAVVMEMIAFRPVRRASPVVMMLTSFAVSAILRILFQNFISARGLPVPVPAALTGAVEVAGLQLGVIQLVSIFVSIASLLLLTRFLRGTRLGIAVRAAAEDFDTTRLMGLNADRVIATAFALSGVLAGIAGVLWVFQRGSVDPLMGFTPLLWAFIAVVIGGMGSLSGAVAGGFLLGALEVALRAYLPDSILAYREAIELALVIAILFVRPNGLIPRTDAVR